MSEKEKALIKYASKHGTSTDMLLARILSRLSGLHGEKDVQSILRKGHTETQEEYDLLQRRLDHLCGLIPLNRITGRPVPLEENVPIVGEIFQILDVMPIYSPELEVKLSTFPPKRKEELVDGWFEKRQNTRHWIDAAIPTGSPSFKALFPKKSTQTGKRTNKTETRVDIDRLYPTLSSVGKANLNKILGQQGIICAGESNKEIPESLKKVWEEREKKAKAFREKHKER